MSKNADWAKILSNFKDFVAAYPNDVVAIGGVAVYLHVKNTLGSNFLESSHDVDFYISLAALSALRDLEEVVPNRRLGKSQIVHEGVEYDVYVERNNKLAIPYDEIVSQAVNLDGIRCAALGHLLILKCEAAKDRQNTAKGDKDFRDIAKIVVAMSVQPSGQNSKIVQDYWQEAYGPILQKVNHRVFLQLCKNNAKVSAEWRKNYDRWTNAIFTKMDYSSGYSDSGSTDGGRTGRD